MMTAETGRHVSGAVAGLAGSIGGLLLSDHNGMPVLLVVTAIAGAVCFGLLSSTERVRDGCEKARQRHMAFANFGTLWLVACAATFLFDVAFPAAVMIGLTMGLFGSAALERMETSALFKDGLASFLKWMLDRMSK